MRRHKSVDIYNIWSIVAGLKNRELVMVGVVGEDCRHEMNDRLPMSFR